MALIRTGEEDHEALLSISHDGDYATAVCLGIGATLEIQESSPCVTDRV